MKMEPMSEGYSPSTRIPPVYVQRYGILPHDYELWNVANKSWLVSMNKIGNYLFFQKGWSTFVQDNSLEFGDFLLFHYAEDSKFNVQFYGKHCCEKDVTTEASTKSSKPRLLQELIHKKIKKSTAQKIDQSSSSSGVDRALTAANKFISKSKYPSFRRVMRPAYLQNSYLDVSASFMAHMNPQKGIVNLQISESDVSWPVNLIFYSKTEAKIFGGWHEFATENALQLDDVCVFELINMNDFVVNVSIFKNN